MQHPRDLETAHRRRRYHRLWIALVPLLSVGLAASACDGDDAVTTPSVDDASADSATKKDGNGSSGGDEDTGTKPKDAGQDTAEDPGTVATEVEPNNGKTATEIGTMKLPGTMNGAIDPANDIDLFAIDLAPGDFWEWTLTPKSGDLSPHVIIFDSAGGLNPNVVGFAGPGSPATLQHFVLRTGTFVVGVRDKRNVGADGGKGGPSYGYALTAKHGTTQPTAVTFPTKKSGKLASVGSVDLYTFTGTGGKGFDIVIKAARKAQPSTLDSRLSLFDITAKKAVITNDNITGSTDSQVGSPDEAPSTYMVIVENEGTDGTDLSYDIEFNLR